MLGKGWVIGLVVVAVCTVEFLLIRSTLATFRADLQQRPNCALVDDAIVHRRAPDKKVKASCRASARGLVYSLTPEDFAAMRAGRRR